MAKTVAFQVRVEPELHTLMLARSSAVGISMNEWINRVMTYAVALPEKTPMTITTTTKVEL